MNYKLFVGIDQSKLTIDVAVLGGAADSEHRQFKNDKKGFASMLKWVRSFESCSDQEILFCSEHTGLYSIRLATFLGEMKMHLWLENPLQIKRSAGVVRGKNDKADAKLIAHYCFIHKHKARLYTLPAKSIRTLKQLLSYREQLVKTQARLKGMNKELKEFNGEAAAIVIKSGTALLRSLTRQIEDINEQMMKVVEQEQELLGKFNLIKSVHGVGKQTALFILVFTNGFTSFTDSRKFACYCGVAPFEYSSGTSIRGRSRVSHLANKKLKSLLTMCALNTIKKENELKNYYDRRIKEGKSAMSVINILRNKLISRIFATVQRGTPYLPELQKTA